MKRVFRYMIMSAAVVAAVACAKEIAETENPSGGNEPEGEGVTFTAYIQNDEAPASPSATKVAIDIDETAGTAKVSFTAGDFVAVSAQKTGTDGKTETIVDRITLNAENINADGSATFTAPNVPADAETYLAYFSDKNTLNSFGWPSYVYTNAKKDGWDFIEIAAGRIPHAAFANCGSDRKLSFRNMLTLLKFRTETSGVSSVEFKGNNGENVIGMVVGNYSTGAVSLVSFNTETNCFPVAKAIVSAPNTDCYIALAPGVTMSKGFTMTAYDASGKVLFASKYDKSFTTVAGKLWDLGKLEDHQMTPYDLWQAGYDLEIGGKTYNKAEYGDGRLVTSEIGFWGNMTYGKNNDGKNGGVYFIDNGGSLKVGGNNYYSSIIVVGNTPGKRADVIFTSGGNYFLGSEENLSHHVLAFQNVTITNQSATVDIINAYSDGNDSKKTLGELIFDDCRINVNRDFVTRKATDQTIEGITIVNSDILVMKDGVSFFGTHNVTGFSLGNVTLKNNVIWSDGTSGTYEDGRAFYFINAPYANGATLGDVVFENNTFYNVDTGNANVWFSKGYLTFCDAQSISVKNNLSFTTAPASKSAAAAEQRIAGLLSVKGMTKEAVFAISTQENNWHDYPQIAFLNASDGREFTKGTVSGVTLVNNADVKEFVNPFESFDLTTGAFKMKSGYTQYGAQR